MLSFLCFFYSRCMGPYHYLFSSCSLYIVHTFSSLLIFFSCLVVCFYIIIYILSPIHHPMWAGFPEQVHPAYSQPVQILLQILKPYISPTALCNLTKSESCNFSHRIFASSFLVSFYWCVWRRQNLLTYLLTYCLLTQDSYFQFKSRKYALGSSF